MEDALRHCAIDTALGLDERLLRGAGITRLDCGAHALHTRTHVGADLPVSRGALDRLTDSLFC